MKRRVFPFVARLLVTIAIVTVVACEREDETPVSPPTTLLADEGSAACDPFQPGCPNGPASSIPSVLLLAGKDAFGNNDPNCEYRIIVRDVMSTPLAGVSVRLQWNIGDYGLIGVCPNQVAPGMTYQVIGGAHTFTATTDALGVARFRVAGYHAIVPTCGDPAGDYRRGKVFANGQEIRPAFAQPGAFTVATLNLSGSSGIDIVDQSYWLQDFGCFKGTPPRYHSRSDYNGNNSIGVDDLSIWLSKFGAGGSVGTCLGNN